MITDKEYPATHSMSTAWFFADLDGNVALFDFNENGPVPTAIHEDCMPYMLFPNLDVDIVNGIPTAKLSEDQIESLLEDCVVEDYLDNLIEIDPQKEAVLLSAYRDKVFDTVICLSRNRNLYWVEECDDVSSDKLEQFEKSGCVTKCYYISDYISDDRYENDKVEFTNGFKSLPFYFYAQTYWPNEEAIRRVYDPDVTPLKLSQFNQKTRDKISVLPLRFAESKYVQIAAYFPYECREEYGENNLVSYSQFPDEQGVNMFYHNGRTANSINAINFSDTPTAIIIANFDMRTYDMKESRDFVSMHGVYYPLECLQAQWQMEELVRTYRPYVLILWDEAVNQLRTWFEVADNEIVVNGESIPYYLNTETMKYRNEIERLINMPYRGVTYKKVLTEEEASQLMNNNKQN